MNSHQRRRVFRQNRALIGVKVLAYINGRECECTIKRINRCEPNHVYLTAPGSIFDHWRHVSELNPMPSLFFNVPLTALETL